MFPLRRRDPLIDPKVLALVMAQSKKDGFQVSESYAIKMLQKNDYKLVPAIKDIKVDINAREFSFSTIPRIQDIGLCFERDGKSSAHAEQQNTIKSKQNTNFI